MLQKLKRGLIIALIFAQPRRISSSRAGKRVEERSRIHEAVSSFRPVRS
jgi:hypothetical protein